MRAGLLTKTITIERATVTVDDYGTPANSWATLATVRAQVLQQSTEDFMRNFGASTEAAIVFRIRWADGIAPGDRVTHDGQSYTLKEVKELGRREGMDLRCLATGVS